MAMPEKKPSSTTDNGVYNAEKEKKSSIKQRNAQETKENGKRLIFIFISHIRPYNARELMQ